MQADVLTKEDAEKVARQANARLHAIRDAERYEENKSLAGKTFRYRNSYSCPEKPSDYWYLYAKVQKVAEDGMLTLFYFETDKYGYTSTKTNTYVHHVSDYEPIRKAVFDKAWQAFQKRIATTKP